MTRKTLSLLVLVFALVACSAFAVQASAQWVPANGPLMDTFIGDDGGSIDDVVTPHEGGDIGEQWGGLLCEANPCAGQDVPGGDTEKPEERLPVIIPGNIWREMYECARFGGWYSGYGC